MTKGERTVFECRACHWRWLSRLVRPRRCPSCLTAAWAQPDRRLRHGLYKALREQKARDATPEARA